MYIYNDVYLKFEYFFFYISSLTLIYDMHTVFTLILDFNAVFLLILDLNVVIIIKYIHTFNFHQMEFSNRELTKKA